VVGLLGEVVKLDEVELVALETFEGAPDLVPSGLVAALDRLRGEEEAIAVLRHPAPHRDLGLAVGGGDIDVVDAVVEEQRQRPLVRPGVVGHERRRAEDDPAGVVAGGPEGPARQGLRHRLRPSRASMLWSS
jgi:hypothetical protein